MLLRVKVKVVRYHFVLLSVLLSELLELPQEFLVLQLWHLLDEHGHSEVISLVAAFAFINGLVLVFVLRLVPDGSSDFFVNALREPINSENLFSVIINSIAFPDIMNLFLGHFGEIPADTSLDLDDVSQTGFNIAIVDFLGLCHFFQLSGNSSFQFFLIYSLNFLFC